jgi:NADPH-dependent glutamate synthase beta subunit-like oxidoreductase
MASTKEKLLSLHIEETQKTANKVSVVGVGQVGMACAFSMLVQVI